MIQTLKTLFINFKGEILATNIFGKQKLYFGIHSGRLTCLHTLLHRNLPFDERDKIYGEKATC
jgi:hypothetical protein